MATVDSSSTGRRLTQPGCAPQSWCLQRMWPQVRMVCLGVCRLRGPTEGSEAHAKDEAPEALRPAIATMPRWGGFSDEHVSARPGDKCPYFFGCLLFHPLIFPEPFVRLKAKMQPRPSQTSSLGPGSKLATVHEARRGSREATGSEQAKTSDRAGKGFAKCKGKGRWRYLSFFFLFRPPW